MSVKLNPQITRREAGVLRKDVGALQAVKAAATSDGKVTKEEAKAVHDAQAKLNRDTFTLTHNAAHMPKLR